MQRTTEQYEKTAGYFLKEIRKKYCLDQKDICGGNIKRSKIAKIEINDENTVLTEEYAREIAENINVLIKKYDEKIDYLYFYDNSLYNIKKAANESATKIEICFNTNDYGNFLKEFNMFVNQYSKYNIPCIKHKIFTTAAEFYSKYKEYSKSHIYYSRALDNAMEIGNKDEIVKSNINVCLSLILMEDCEEAIQCLYYILETESEMSNANKYQGYHKIGHAHLKLKEYEAALLSFEQASIYVDANNLFYIADLYVQKAYCYRYMQKIPEAIKILKEGLSLLNSERYEELKDRQDLFENKLYLTKLSLVKNLISACRYNRDKRAMELYIKELNILMDPIADRSDPFIIDVYNDLFDDYVYLGNVEAAELCITIALEISKEQENFYYTNEVLKKLFVLYKLRDDKEKINKLLPEVKSILTKYPNMFNNNNIGFTYFRHYFQINENNPNNVICGELLNLIEKEE